MDMIKKTIYALMAVILLAACQERHPAPFGDIAGVYFNNLSGGMTVTDSLDITFVYESADSVKVPVQVQLVGRAADVDRPIDVTVTSDNAVEGVDYILPGSAVMPAGASATDYVVTLIRTGALKSGRKMLSLEIHENSVFSLPVTEIRQIADTVSTLGFRIYFSDMFTKSPAAWDENLVGEFSHHKFELICRVMDLDPADFNDPSAITLAKLLYISAEMTEYVSEQLQKKESGEEYDKDVFDPATGEPVSFR